MMEAADRELVELFGTLDPDATARWPVAWAGRCRIADLIRYCP